MRTPAHTPRPTGDRRRWWALAVIALGQLMVVFDVTIVNVALPTIGRDLGVSESGRSWVISAYTLAFAGLLLAGGKIADNLGARKAFLIALAGFAAASAAGGAATGLATLLAARAGQGAFAALLAPAAMSMVAATFPGPRERGRAFAVFGVVMGGGAGVGLVLGGVLTEHLSWHWTLYINVPLALCAGLAAVLVLPASPAHRTRVDMVGAVLATAGLVALIYGSSTAIAHGWAAPVTLSALGAGIVLLTAFATVQTRVRHPLLPPRIVTDRNRGGAYLAFVLVMIGMSGMFLLVSYYLQTIAGYTAVRAGAAFLPFAATTLLASTAAGRVMTRLRTGTLLAIGLLLAAAGLAWLTRLDVGTGYAAGVLPALLLIGAGVGALSPVAANLATLDVPAHQTGIAGRRLQRLRAGRRVNRGGRPQHHRGHRHRRPPRGLARRRHRPRLHGRRRRRGRPPGGRSGRRHGPGQRPTRNRRGRHHPARGKGRRATHARPRFEHPLNPERNMS
ncbi:MFS transporter [Actinomadura madurae]|uniref:MFS transporter n=1 Tax=Actinomadura madurae TaxID=1993 RepID=UPI0020D22BB0|nr:MFS transporter [Actinomadura madurae]MCQ0008156.1 MFS transporter [Actinomadura madurae]